VSYEVLSQIVRVLDLLQARVNDFSERGGGRPRGPRGKTRRGRESRLGAPEALIVDITKVEVACQALSAAHAEPEHGEAWDVIAVARAAATIARASIEGGGGYARLVEALQAPAGSQRVPDEDSSSFSPIA
jgi:hypothetical protein